MPLYLGWGSVTLAVFLAVLIFWLGAIAEYLWHAYRHRHH